MIYSFIEEHKELWPVTLMCRTLKVSPQGFYGWCSRPKSQQEQRREALVVEIRSIHAEIKQRYGSPRIHAKLQARSINFCVNTVAKLMHNNDIRAITAQHESFESTQRTLTMTCRLWKIGWIESLKQKVRMRSGWRISHQTS